ncbi:hypothetical protein TUBRATIS_12710 [Tubulinosema ratisbonensis]|uniref:Uncharacterized protein n=1 Tax=Tubulinosema ratisbonensis TaxID=291195 RepID=A0A437AMI9_9MICR|nr:hypothetical protein TUBRATIS_12710 [Tubulinosema ratisbonensis]
MNCSCKKPEQTNLEENTKENKLNTLDCFKRVSADLGLSVLVPNYYREPLLPQKRSKEEYSFKEYSFTYLNFRKIIDLSPEKRSILDFDLQTFAKIFSANYCDEFIYTFIKKLIYDPVVYEKQNREEFFLILVMAFYYTLSENKLTKELRFELKKKISENLIYFNKNKKINFNFYILKEKSTETNKETLQVKINCHKILTNICENFVINNIIINLYNFSNFYEEGQFLNYFYKNICKRMNNELLLDFKRRLYENIKKIDHKNLFYFLKIVFLNDSVIFDKVSDEQLIIIMLSFLTKEKDPYSILEYLLGYFIYNEEYNLILDKIIEIKKEKSTFFALKKEISFSKIKEEFLLKKESFFFVKQLFDELINIIKFTNELVILENVFLFLQLICFIFLELKNEFLIQLDKQFTKIINEIFKIIHKETKKPFLLEREAVDSANYSWPILSKILLHLNKQPVSIKKKDKKNKERVNNSIIDLVELIRKCECALKTEGLDLKIKKWGIDFVKKE